MTPLCQPCSLYLLWSHWTSRSVKTHVRSKDGRNSEWTWKTPKMVGMNDGTSSSACALG